MLIHNKQDLESIQYPNVMNKKCVAYIYIMEYCLVIFKSINSFICSNVSRRGIMSGKRSQTYTITIKSSFYVESKNLDHIEGVGKIVVSRDGVGARKDLK